MAVPLDRHEGPLFCFLTLLSPAIFSPTPFFCSTRKKNSWIFDTDFNSVGLQLFFFKPGTLNFILSFNDFLWDKKKSLIFNFSSGSERSSRFRREQILLSGVEVGKRQCLRLLGTCWGARPWGREVTAFLPTALLPHSGEHLGHSSKLTKVSHKN